MGGALRLDEPTRAELEKLKSALRRLASQLSGMHRPVTSVPELEAAGKWAEFSLVQDRVAAEAASVLRIVEQEDAHNPQLARRVHDSLLSCLVTLDCAPNRPGCLRQLKLPTFSGACECGDEGCGGNRFTGATMVLQHSKTSRSRDAIRVDFGGTTTGQLLEHHIAWAHGLLLADDAGAGGSVWLNTRGKPFATDESFSAYLPRVLARLDLPHLSFTTLRHAAIVAAADWASKDEMEGLARSIGTSVRKCNEVYDYRASERSAGRFLTQFRLRAGGSPDDSNSPSSPPAVLHTPTPQETTEPVHTAQPGETPRAGMFQRFAGTFDVLSRFVGMGSHTADMPRNAEPAPVLLPAPMLLDYEPTFKASAVFNPAPLMALPAPMQQVNAKAIVPVAKPRVRARLDEGTSFADFLAMRKKQNTGGPGRSAAPVVRRLSRAEAEAALEAGTAATRAAYAFCYDFETHSGNLKWLRNKVLEAIGEDAEGGN